MKTRLVLLGALLLPAVALAQPADPNAAAPAAKPTSGYDGAWKPGSAPVATTL